jgi:hypothetical protein
MLSLLLAVTSALAGDWRQDDWRVIEDSLRTMHPRARASWLSAHGIEWPGVNAPRAKW